MVTSLITALKKFLGLVIIHQNDLGSPTIY